VDWVFEGIPDELRSVFWQKCTGLYAYKSNYVPGYYKELNQAQESKVREQYPNSHFNQIDKDLDRTFPQDPWYTDSVK
jgi:hypothetical protein